MDKLAIDVRYAVRTLLKSPGYAAVAILTLALGIGANAAIFGLIEAALLHPLAGIPQPERLIMIGRTIPTGPNANAREFDTLSYPNYLDLRDQATQLEGVVAYSSTLTSVRTHDHAEMLDTEMVSGNYFGVLQIVPARGRLLQAADDDPKSALAAVIGYGFWQRLGAPDDILGTPITVAGKTLTVVGVAPRGFRGVDPASITEVWVPLPTQSSLTMGNFNYLTSPEPRRIVWLDSFARLKPGATFESAKAQVETIGKRLAAAYPQENEHTGMTAIQGLGFGPESREQIGRLTATLLGAVGLLLLLACANVANLMLARAAARRREMAIRVALGASRMRLIRQFLTESTLLAIVAGCFGLLLSVWMSDGLQRLSPGASVPLPKDISIDTNVVWVTFAISLLAGLLFGAAPAMQSFVRELVPVLKESSAQVSGSRSKLRVVLTVAEISVSLVLLASAGLLVRTLQHFQQIDPGFRARNVVMVSMFPALEGYDEARSRQLYAEVQRQLEAAPGMQGVTAARVRPLYPGGWGSSYESPELSKEQRSSDFNTVMPNYFEVMGIDIVEGRGFAKTDQAESPWVAVINQTLAAKLWPNVSAVGKHIRVGNDAQLREIVGVARDVKTRNLTEKARTYIWLPMSQPMPFWRTSAVIEMKTDLPMALAAAEARNTLAKIDAHLPLYAPRTLSQQFAYSYWQQRIAAWLIGAFAALAMLLASIGVYGVISYQVAARTRELGIRMALGASRKDVLALVLRHGLLLAVSGVGAGVAGALVATRALKSLLVGVTVSDPLTFAASALLLAFVALAASFVPAYRASRVDPMVALRYE